MENSVDKNWNELVVKLSQRFGEGLDLQAILFLIGLQELGQGYQKLNKNCMSTHMLSKTKNWIDPKTSESTSPDIVLQKVFTKYLATHCRRYVQGEWEEKRNKNIYYKTYYSLFLRQVAYNCLCIVVINTQTKSSNIIEDFGERIREKVLDKTGVQLEWEIQIKGQR